MPKKPKILLQAPKGMHDILPDVYPYYEAVYKKAQEIAEYYGFLPIQTPHLERIEIFTSTLGETSDIIEKEMYTLKTKGGDRLALRPEGTAGIMRSYIEHGMQTLPQPVMLWYKGSFFRHENPQKGRFREFQQFGLEIINEEGPIAEAILIKVISLILEEIGIKPVVVHVNSLGDKDCRNAYRKDLLAYYRKNLKNLCKNCQRRYKTNPLRLLDCKEIKCNEVKQEAPQMINYLCPACKKHFKEVLEFLDSNEIPYFLNPHLVRGLDYYSRTVFEIFEDKEETEENPLLALAAGGRYDYLAKSLAGKNLPAAGGAIGIDRIVQIMIDNQIKIRHKKEARVFLIQLGDVAKQKSLQIIEMFRKAHIPLLHSIAKDNLRNQLKLADKHKVDYSLILGQKEALENSIIVKDMNLGSQDIVPIEKVVDFIKKKLKQ